MKNILLLISLFLSLSIAVAKEPKIYADVDGSNYIEVCHKVYDTDYDYHIDTLKIPLTKNKDGVIFSKIVEMDNTSADDLYFRAKLAAADFWRDAKEASVLDDDERKVLICKMRTNWHKSPDAMVSTVIGVRCTVKIECRDNRYRISLYDFISIWGGYNIEYDYNRIFNYGVKGNGCERSGIGVSFRAWKEVADGTFDKLGSLMEGTPADQSNDW